MHITLSGGRERDRFAHQTGGPAEDILPHELSIVLDNSYQINYFYGVLRLSLCSSQTCVSYMELLPLWLKDRKMVNKFSHNLHISVPSVCCFLLTR